MDTRRFNSPDYKRQIRAVRAYKRTVRNVPEHPWKRAMHKIGMASILRQILFVFIFAALIYLIYFAPILRLSTLVVNGADSSASAQIQQRFNNFKQDYTFLFPEKNILFFSKAKFANYLLKNDLQVMSVVSLNKKLPHTLVLGITQRLPAYTLESNNNYYILSSDGKVSAQIQDGDYSLPFITDLSNENISVGAQFLNPGANSFVTDIVKNISPIAGDVDHYAIAVQNSTDFYVFLKSHTKIIFDDSTDAKAYLNRLTTLLAQFTPQQKTNFAYIDLRFNPNAYGCFKTDKCAQAQ